MPHHLIRSAICAASSSISGAPEVGDSVAISGVGAHINAIDSQKDVNDAYTLQLQQTLSSVKDLDYASAASLLNEQLLALQAAQQSFIKLQRLSLFEYL
jgi:flagellar hook-associated protein 3 FlgL